MPSFDDIYETKVEEIEVRKVIATMASRILAASFVEGNLTMNSREAVVQAQEIWISTENSVSDMKPYNEAVRDQLERLEILIHEAKKAHQRIPADVILRIKAMLEDA